MLFTDKVRIISTDIDIIFNSEEEGTEMVCKAYIENNTKLRYGADGAPYTPSFLIFLPRGTDISLHDKIEIVKLHGVDPVGDETGEKAIAQIKRVGGFSISHLEVYV